MIDSAKSSEPKIIGLIGGVASGKTFVARELQALGAGLLDADVAGHDVLTLPQVKSALRARWGDGVFGHDGHVIRPVVAKIVFAPTDEGRRELAFLESLSHPLIGERLREQAQQLAAAGHKVLVLDAPVMLKAGWDRLCDAIVFVDAPDDVRLQRALARGWSPAEFDAREAAQESPEFKRKRADFVVESGGDAEAMRSQVGQLWQKIAFRVE